MPNSNFIESLEFNEDFLPFRNEDKIFFGGKKQVQDLIKFYLKNKPENENVPDEEISKNAKRFKINCVLGNNGGGKSRLFEYLMNNNLRKNIFTGKKSGINYYNITLQEDSITGEKSIYNNETNKFLNEGISISYKDFKRFDKEFILDDFLKLSGNINKSINKEILNLGFSDFNAKVFIFLSEKNQYFQGIFKEFLNLSNFENFKLETEFYINDNLFKETGVITNGRGGFLYSKEQILKFLNVIHGSTNFNLDFNRYSIEKQKEIPKDSQKGILKELYLYTIIYNLIKDISSSSNYGDSIFKDIIKGLEGIKKLLEINGRIKINLLNFNLDLLIKEFKKAKKSIKIFKYQKDLREVLRQYIGSYFKYEIYIKDIEKIKKEECIKYSILQHNIYYKNLYTVYFKYNIFYDSNRSFNNLSAGEKIMLTRFTNIYMKIIEDFELFKNKLKKDGKNDKEIDKILFDIVILIDEPDLHLHLDWQKKYIQKLIDVFSTLDTNIKLHFIIATHSPFIISDLPNESIVVLDGGEKNKYNGEYTEIKEYKNKTFGANFVDIIRDGFFFQDEALMGSFAENVIGKIADLERGKFLGDIEEDLGGEEKIIEKIGDDFLRDNLLYFKGKKND